MQWTNEETLIFGQMKRDEGILGVDGPSVKALLALLFRPERAGTRLKDVGVVCFCDNQGPPWYTESQTSADLYSLE